MSEFPPTYVRVVLDTQRMTQNMKKRQKPDKKETLKRVKELFWRASQQFEIDKETANKTVQKARKLAMSQRLHLPPELKRSFCKHCHAYLKPGRNARIRINKGRVIIYCLECRKFIRIVLPKKR